MLLIGSILATASSWLSPTTALAFLLHLGDESGLQIETPGALYAGDSKGDLSRVVEAGAPGPVGGRISDIGVPSLSADGWATFGAEVRMADQVSWQILRAKLNGAESPRIEPAFELSSMRSRCIPILKSDPYVATGRDGSITFVAFDQTGGVALFRYATGRLDCSVRVGEVTAEGHLIANLGFGSAQMTDSGATILRATVADTDRPGKGHFSRNAVLLALPGHPAKEIAVEGDRSADGIDFGAQFGEATISDSAGSLMIAFTNRMDKTTSLFGGAPQRITRIYPAKGGPKPAALTFLSNGRPALGSDGSIAIMAASGGRKVIAVIRAGEPFVVAREGDSLGRGHTLVGLADPVAEVSGRVLTEGTDEKDHNRVFSFSVPDTSTKSTSTASMLLSDTVQVFPYSLAFDRAGRYAFLAVSDQHFHRETSSAIEGTSL